MTQSWKARPMIPGRDTISIMALHYNLAPTKVKEVIRRAAVEVIREDGFRGTVTLVEPYNPGGGYNGRRSRKVVGWSDGEVGVNPATTKLTKAAIMAVSRWAHSQGENNGDN